MLGALTAVYRRKDGAERLPALRLTLEPEFVGFLDNLADLADIDAMLAAAQSGLSARSRQLDRCRWLHWGDDGEAIVTLDLYVWPSRPELRYRLDLPQGVSSTEPELCTRERRWKFWMDGGSNLQLPWRLDPGTASWHAAIGCMDAWSQPIAPPGLRLEGADMELDGDAYGVLVVDGVAHGFLHRISISLQKIIQTGGADEINRIEIESIPVRALWIDEKGEEQVAEAEMHIPHTCRDILASCEGRPEIYVSVFDDRELPWTIYYHACTGKVLLRVRDKR